MSSAGDLTGIGSLGGPAWDKQIQDMQERSQAMQNPFTASKASELVEKSAYTCTIRCARGLDYRHNPGIARGVAASEQEARAAAGKNALTAGAVYVGSEYTRGNDRLWLCAEHAREIVWRWYESKEAT